MTGFEFLFGAQIINSLLQTATKPIFDKMNAKRQQVNTLIQMENKHKLDLEILRLNKEADWRNQSNIQQLSHQFRLQEAEKQFNLQLEMWQTVQFNEKIWPINTPFNHSSLRLGYMQNQNVPIKIFMAKTDRNSTFAKCFQSDVQSLLSNFLHIYSSNPNHLCFSGLGDWKDGFQDDAFINALWHGLKGQPTIIINPIQTASSETLTLNVSMWGLAGNGVKPLTETLITIPFSLVYGRIKREETICCKEIPDVLRSKALKENIDVLEKEQDFLKNGGSQEIADRLLTKYQLTEEIQKQVISRFTKEYSHLLSCVTGMYADIYHLIEYGETPYMPHAVNTYNRNHANNYQIPEMVIEHYQKALTNLACTDYLQDKLPFAYLNVAKAIQFNPQKAQEILQEGVGLWANRKLDVHKEIRLPETLDDCVRLLCDNAEAGDKPYLQSVKNVLLTLGESEVAKEIDNIHINDVDIPQEMIIVKNPNKSIDKSKFKF